MLGTDVEFIWMFFLEVKQNIYGVSIAPMSNLQLSMKEHEKNFLFKLFAVLTGDTNSALFKSSWNCTCSLTKVRGSEKCDLLRVHRQKTESTDKNFAVTDMTIPCRRCSDLKGEEVWLPLLQ